jgi:hypothetical protein
MKVKYVGPYDEVEVASLGRTWPVKQGETIELPDDVAASLEGQSSFELAASKTTGRKATTSKDDEA